MHRHRGERRSKLATGIPANKASSNEYEVARLWRVLQNWDRVKENRHRERNASVLGQVRQ